ncbi:MAG: hypothetical protein ACL7BU_15795 [Candidatus Phlomobacter fragariae]
MQQRIAALLQAQVMGEQFIQTADKQSLVLTLTRCDKDGLMPDGIEASLVFRSTKINNQFVKKTSTCQWLML